ncbi:SHOCT domain-containing protein [Myxococcus sp. K15C18031901]|uniref:SHOCT domain-containing protein n=1 Tax=Myxococcus dinghuensis TaxID=2906761 RepID=UPI0020A83808|nr:SHOCT domain-containing protein [Myxococcus dinghuensis]MCP3097811.1 SHOCT domain-containing protein [Myxococcus dinghuensis]
MIQGFDTSWLLVGVLVVASFVAQAFLLKDSTLLWFIIDERRLRARGEPAEATVLELEPSSWRINKRRVIVLRLQVRQRGHPAYEARTRTTLAGWQMSGVMEKGMTLEVRVDPKDPRRVAVVRPLSFPRPLNALLPRADNVQAMRDLQRLRDEGLISADEFEQKRSAILERL